MPGYLIFFPSNLRRISMRIALFIDEDDVNTIRVHLEDKYNGEVTMTQVEAYIDDLVKQKVQEIKNEKTTHTTNGTLES